MFSAMRRTIAAIAFAFLLGQSALCLAGVLRHACEDCPSGAACGHEAECADDPCIETAVRPTSGIGESDPSMAAACVTVPPWDSAVTVAAHPRFLSNTPDASFPPLRPDAPLRL